ncbi:MAG: hypothetical protein Mars2KO_15000 [Maribacter sp.]
MPYRAFLFLLLFSSCSFSTSAKNPDSQPKEWTVLFIIDARGGLIQEAIRDLNQIAEIGSSKNINVIVELTKNRSKGDFQNWSGTKRFYVNRETQFTQEEDIKGLDGPEALSTIQEIQDGYPSKKLMVVFWGHGNVLNMPNGLTSFALDDTANNPQKMDIALFDSCLMASMETAYELKDKAKYMIASQEIVKADQSHDFKKILQALEKRPEVSGRDFSEKIMTLYESQPLQNKGPVSAIAIERMFPLEVALNKFAVHLNAVLLNNVNTIGEVTRIRNKTKTLGRRLRDGKTVDVKTFFLNYIRSSNDAIGVALAKEVINALGLVRLTHRSTSLDKTKTPYFNGLSIYYPIQNVDATYEDLDFGKEYKWYDLLQTITDLKQL